MEEKCGKCGNFRHRSQRSLTLARHISANLGTSRRISIASRSRDQSSKCEAPLGTSRHSSAHLGVTASHRPARCARTQDAPDRQCGTLSRTSLRLTQHSFTRNGPREGRLRCKTHVLRGAPWLPQSALGLRDAALHVSGSVNAGGMLTPNAANHNSGARA